MQTLPSGCTHIANRRVEPLNYRNAFPEPDLITRWHPASGRYLSVRGGPISNRFRVEFLVTTRHRITVATRSNARIIGLITRSGQSKISFTIEIGHIGVQWVLFYEIQQPIFYGIHSGACEAVIHNIALGVLTS